jgi:hypothetical protein
MMIVTMIVGWVEREARNPSFSAAPLMGFASLNPSYRLEV